MSLCIFLIVALLLLSVVADAETVPLWGRWEGRFDASGPAASETELTVELTSPTGKRHVIDGFWDGGQTWRARFQPDEEGRWRYRTRSAPAVAGLEEQTGLFECRRNEVDNRFLQHGPVRVAPNGFYLQHADGTPFFWLGDTTWNGPLLSARQDWEDYLNDRAAKRFSVIQFNVIAPWRTAPTDEVGQVAFTGREKIAINPRFFQRMDARIDSINAKGLLAAPVLLWSLTDKDPGQYLPEEACIRLIRYEVARYGAHHLAWILAGDNPYDGERAARWKRIGRAVFGGRPHAPVMTHPTGMNWPWEEWRGEAWLDILGYQSGHGDDADTLRWIHSGPPAQHWSKTPHRPVINLEPPYENHVAYQSRRPHSAHNVRRAVYWSLLNAPTAGLTYGGHGVWSWHTKPGEEPTDHPGTGPAPTWREAMALPGSAQMKVMADLFTALPWWTLRPDTAVLAEQPGGDDPAKHVSAARSERGDLALLYLPVGGAVRLRPGALPDGLRAEWIDPRTGQRTPARRETDNLFRAPDAQDWVLLLR